MRNRIGGILILWLSCAELPALELFGIDLLASGQQELRDAAKKAGFQLVSESDDTWFDIYDSSSIIEQSSRLYLGFTKNDARIAFVEYEFPGLREVKMVKHITAKYGDPEILDGLFISDKTYLWSQPGIDITFRVDWGNYRSLLSYINPVAMNELRKEQAAAALETEAGRKIPKMLY